MAGMPYGISSMLKEGYQHFSGVEEAVVKNIEACKGLAQITRTSLGPNGAPPPPAPRVRAGGAGAAGMVAGPPLLMRRRLGAAGTPGGAPRCGP
jgi:hypothetical protein